MRTTSVSKRVNDDFRAYRAAVKKESVALTEQLQSVRRSQASVSTIKRLRQKIRRNNMLLLATLPENQYQEWQEHEEAAVLALSVKEQPYITRENAFLEVMQTRNLTISAIKENVDKEIRLNRAHERPLEGFKKATAQLIINEGVAFNTESFNREDTRGVQNLTAASHIKENCSPAIITDYQENYTWQSTAEYQDITESGTAARISCACGEVYDQFFTLEDNGYSSMLERLMNSD